MTPNTISYKYFWYGLKTSSQQQHYYNSNVTISIPFGRGRSLLILHFSSVYRVAHKISTLAARRIRDPRDTFSPLVGCDVDSCGHALLATSTQRSAKLCALLPPPSII